MILWWRDGNGKLCRWGEMRSAMRIDFERLLMQRSFDVVVLVIWQCVVMMRWYAVGFCESSYDRSGVGL